MCSIKALLSWYWGERSQGSFCTFMLVFLGSFSHLDSSWCVCICVYAHVHLHEVMCNHRYRGGGLPWSLCTLFTEAGHLAESQAHQFRQSSQPDCSEVPCSVSSALGLQKTTLAFMWVLEVGALVLTCRASTLSTEPPPEPIGHS